MKRRFLTVIVLSTVVNAVLVAVLGFKRSDGCDASARGLVTWSDNRGELGLPRGEWVTVEPAPEDAELPPCRLGRRPVQEGFRPV